MSLFVVRRFSTPSVFSPCFAHAAFAALARRRRGPPRNENNPRCFAGCTWCAKTCLCVFPASSTPLGSWGSHSPSNRRHSCVAHASSVRARRSVCSLGSPRPQCITATEASSYSFRASFPLEIPPRWRSPPRPRVPATTAQRYEDASTSSPAPRPPNFSSRSRILPMK